MNLYMKYIKNIFHKQIFYNFYLHLSICLIILSISCWSLFYFDLYPVAQSESGIFFYPSYVFTDNLRNWSEFYMGARNSIHQSYQTFIFRFLITPGTTLNPFYIQFSYYLIMFYLGFLGFYKCISVFNSSSKNLNLYLSLLYIFNPVSAFFLLRFQYPYITFYYLFPLIFYLTHKALTSDKFKDFLTYTFLNFLLLALFSVIYAAMPTLFLLFFFWLFYSLFFIFFKFIQNPKIILNLIIRRFIPFFVIWFFINMFWFVPFLVELGNPNTLIPVKEVLNKNENVQTFVFFSNRDSGILSILTLLTDEFLSFLNRRQWVQVLILLFSLVPLTIIVFNIFEILKKRSSYLKKFNINYFILISLLFTMFVFIRGANEPFGKVIKYIFINVPIFQVLRNPFEKISLIFTFFFILVFVLSIINLYLKYKSLRVFMFLIVFSYVFFVSHKMFNTKLLLGPFPPFNSPKVGFKLEVPNSYTLISKEINRNKNKIELSRTLLVPTVQEGITYNWNKGYIGVDFIQNYISNDSYSFVSPDSYDSRKQLILNLPYAKDTAGLLQLFGFKNIVFRNDFDYLSREINNPQVMKENLLLIPHTSSFETIPLRNIHLIFSEEKYNQMNFGRVINSDPPYRVPMDWTRNVYFRLNLPVDNTIPDRTSYRFIVNFNDTEQIRDLTDFKANNNRKRVSFDDILRNDSICSNCFSTNFIYTEDTRPVNSLEFMTRLNSNTQYLKIDDIYISYYKNSDIQAKDLKLVKDYPEHKLSHYQVVNRDLPIFVSPKEFKVISNYTYLLSNNVNPLEFSYLLETKDLKAFTLPSGLTLKQSDIFYNKISNSEYDLEIKPKEIFEGSYSTLLTFNFSADSLWKIVKVDEKFKLGQNIFMFEDTHFMTNTYANTWILENIPSSGVKLKLIYLPKVYFNILYPISVIFSLSLSLYLIYLVLKDNFNARKFK